MRTIELLAPAKNTLCGIAAIDHGADAVYIGAKRYGARAAAGNSAEDIRRLCDYAHQFGAKVYVTLNTILYDEEIDDALQLAHELEQCGIDAFIVQDMALLSRLREETSVPLHASTQTDNRNSEKATWLHNIGFKRVVLARELSLEEIRTVHEKVPNIELEVFVHGSLCVSYSGACYASEYCFGRSANRGECAQFCRLAFNVTDDNGKLLAENCHILSLKDMCRIDYLEELLAVGVSALKIEGRLKDVSYIKNVVSAYSRQLNNIIAQHPTEYRRASLGNVSYAFTPNLKKTFNRGFTEYFLQRREPNMSSMCTPKVIGEYVGKVKEIAGNVIVVSGLVPFANGDGLCFFGDGHKLEGFRVNRAAGNHLYPFVMPRNLRKGMDLYRNNDQGFEKILSGKTAERKISVDVSIDVSDGAIRLAMSCKEGNIAVSTLEESLAQKANTPQRDSMMSVLGRLGGTPFKASSITISEAAAGMFVPSSVLSGLRRDTVEKLRRQIIDSTTIKVLHRIIPKETISPLQAVDNNDESKPERLNIANVSNSTARQFYDIQGLKGAKEAFEIVPVKKGNYTLMTCRYCIKYELGHCTRHGDTQPPWREPLWIKIGDGRRFAVTFNCKRCEMTITSP